MSLFVLIFIFLVILSIFSSRDIFSPAKIYISILFVFFGEVLFYQSASLEFNLVILIVYTFALLLIILEFLGLKVDLKSDKYLPIKKTSIVRRLWLLTIVPLVAQYILIAEMGGLSGYLISITERVYAWKGYGIYLMLIRLISVISYFYFAQLIISKPDFKGKLLFAFHFCIFVALALLSGSRSMLLWNIVYMVILHHYLVKRVTYKYATIIFLMVISSAMVLGTLRDSFSVDESGFSSGVDFEKNVLNMSNFSYGTKPIELLISLDDEYEIELGSTYLTVFTNLIPRSIWPGKPDPGGIIFTRDILGDPFGGFSYYSTGLFGEAFINFGLEFGSIFALLLFSFLYYLYFIYISIMNKQGTVFQISIYPFLLLGLPAYLYAEFTTNTLSILFFKISLFYFVYKFTTVRFKF